MGFGGFALGMGQLGSDAAAAEQQRQKEALENFKLAFQMRQQQLAQQRMALQDKRYTEQMQLANERFGEMTKRQDAATKAANDRLTEEKRYHDFEMSKPTGTVVSRAVDDVMKRNPGMSYEDALVEVTKSMSGAKGGGKGATTYQQKLAWIDEQEANGVIDHDFAQLMRTMVNVPGIASTFPTTSTGQQGQWVYNPETQRMEFVQVPTSHTSRKVPMLPSPHAASAGTPAHAAHTGKGTMQPQQAAPSTQLGGHGVRTFPGLTRQTPEEQAGIRLAQKAAADAKTFVVDYNKMKGFATIALGSDSAGFAAQRMLYAHVRAALDKSGRLTQNEYKAAWAAGSFEDRLKRIGATLAHGNLPPADVRELLAIAKDAMNIHLKDARETWQFYVKDQKMPPWLDNEVGGTSGMSKKGNALF